MNSISVTNTAVYVGGNFSMANSVPRGHLAAFDPNTGALLGWAPTADTIVQAMLVTPDHSRVILGGGFRTSTARRPTAWPRSTPTTARCCRGPRTRSCATPAPTRPILSLSTDGTSVFSTAYVFGNNGNFEGVMSADPDRGNDQLAGRLPR